jgi:hypothetical protein
MIFLVILLVIIILWLQYPLCENDKDKKQSQYTQIFNSIKTPIIVICFIIIIISTYSCKKPALNAYVSVPKY